MMERNRKPNEDQSGTSVFTTLGTLVLTARPYESASRSTDTHTNTTSSERSAVDANGASLKGEIFQIVNKDVSDVIVTYMYGFQMSPNLITNCAFMSQCTYMNNHSEKGKVTTTTQQKGKATQHNSLKQSFFKEKLAVSGGTRTHMYTSLLYVLTSYTCMSGNPVPTLKSTPLMTLHCTLTDSKYVRVYMYVPQPPAHSGVTLLNHRSDRLHTCTHVYNCYLCDLC